MLCLENGLSMIKEPKPSWGGYGTWLGEGKPPTIRGQLERLIGDALEHGCKDFDSFLAAMEAAGMEIKRGKHLAFKIPGGKRFVRCDSLGDDYTETAIMELISGRRIISSKEKVASVKPNMLIDIQARMRQITSPGFERWAQIYNIKEMAKTKLYLQEHSLMDYAVLEKTCEAAVQKNNAMSSRTKAANEIMKEISELQKHNGA